MKKRILIGVIAALLTFSLDASAGKAEETKQVEGWKVLKMEEYMVTPQGVTVVKKRAYANDTKLTGVIIANGVTTIGTEAFAGCTNLRGIRIPNSVTKIGKNVFKGCPHVVVLVESGISQKVIDQLYLQELQFKVVGRNDDAINGMRIGYPEVGSIYSADNIRYTVTKKTDTVREVTVKSVELETKKNVIIPATVTLCRKSYKVVGIEKNAFKRAKKMKTVTIGKNVKKIDNQAFKNCKKLKTVKILAKNCKFSGKGIWKGTSEKLVVKVPKSVLKKMQKRLKKSGLKKAVIKAL